MKRKPMSGVYTITNCINNKIYVGCSSDIDKRIGDHKSALKNNSHPNSYLQSTHDIYGMNSLIFEILVDCEEVFMYSEENFWVNMLNTFDRNFGYNLLSTNPNNINKRHSEETKLKISKAGVGRPTVWKGRKHTEESKSKISESLLGRIVSSESIAKGVETRHKHAEERGYYTTEETRTKISNSNKHPKSIEHIESLIKASTRKKAIVMYDLEWNFLKEFDSLSDARRELGCAVNLIFMALKNSNRSAKGFKFKYKGNEN